MKLKFILPMALLVIAVITTVIYRTVEAPPPQSAGLTAEVRVTATGLYSAFQQDESAAGNLYNDKLIEVSGTVRAIAPTTNGTEVLLETGDPMGAVVCDFKAGEQVGLEKGATARIQGFCAGYNMDVLLQRCSLVR